jgi:hypothetical protein
MCRHLIVERNENGFFAFLSTFSIVELSLWHSYYEKSSIYRVDWIFSSIEKPMNRSNLDRQVLTIPNTCADRNNYWFRWYAVIDIIWHVLCVSIWIEDSFLSTCELERNFNSIHSIEWQIVIARSTTMIHWNTYNKFKHHKERYRRTWPDGHVKSHFDSMTFDYWTILECDHPQLYCVKSVIVVNQHE